MKPSLGVTIQTPIRNEMYNCTKSSSPQHHNLDNNDNDNGSNNTNVIINHHPQQSPSRNGAENNLDGGNRIRSNTNGSYTEHKIQGFEISQHSAPYDEQDVDTESSVATQQGPNNEHLLGTAFCTFMGFALVQTAVAFWAGSEAMLGDSAAMIVDALTYLFNWFAERKKANYGSRDWADACPMPSCQDAETRQRILARTKRKKVLQLEIIPPVLSVSTLIVVTAFVLRQAIHVLILDRHRAIALQANPNIQVMMSFSIANLGLDLVNVANFAKAKHLFGYETSEETQGHEALPSTDAEENAGKDSTYHTTKRTPSHDDLDGCDEDQDHTANLNMCSAYTVSCETSIILSFLKVLLFDSTGSDLIIFFCSTSLQTPCEV